MIRGLYTAASGMLAMQNRQESLSNNLANINTPGYKQDDGIIRAFPEQLLSRMNDSNGLDIQGLPNMPGLPPVIGRLHTGVYMSEALPNFAQGDIAQTDNQLDVALTDNVPIPVNAELLNGKKIQPRLFYSVAQMDNPAGVAEDAQLRYTRNGNFNVKTVNDQGYLVTSEGYYVLDNQKRPIQLNDTQKVKFTADGQVFFQDPEQPEGTYLPTSTRLGIKVANNPLQLIRDGNNLYRFQGEEPLQNLEDHPEYQGFYAIRQGWIERANVDPTRTMTDMMTALRSYEANQRMISTIDATLDKAVNEIGRVNG